MLRLLSFASVLALASAQCDNKDYSYDYMLLVQQWPPAYNDNRSYATLHGLWPSRSGSRSTTYPCTCTDETFDASQVTALSANMAKFWPSLMGPNQDFWSHEWSKHGTCATLQCAAGKRQFEYFNMTLTKRLQYNFVVGLTTNGIQPGATRSHTELSDALFKKYGTRPLLGCVNGNQLAEVSFCLDTKTLKVITCDPAVVHGKDETNNCPTTGITWQKASGGGGGGGSCAPNQQHGPACTTDAECTSVPSCIRCAHSGFCTSTPA